MGYSAMRSSISSKRSTVSAKSAANAGRDETVGDVLWWRVSGIAGTLSSGVRDDTASGIAGTLSAMAGATGAAAAMTAIVPKSSVRYEIIVHPCSKKEKYIYATKN